MTCIASQAIPASVGAVFSPSNAVMKCSSDRKGFYSIGVALRIIQKAITSHWSSGELPGRKRKRPNAPPPTKAGRIKPQTTTEVVDAIMVSRLLRSVK